MTRTTSLLVALFIVFTPAMAPAEEPEEVTTCGQVLQRDGFLSADLDCSSDFVNAPTVVVGRGGTLDLRGFHLISRPSETDHPNAAVHCVGRCKVLGPGTVVGSDVPRSTVVGGGKAARVEIDGAVLSGGDYSVYARHVRLRNAVVTGARSMGLWSSRAFVFDSEVIGNGTGVEPCLQRCIGVWAEATAKIVRSTLTGNGRYGIIAGRTRISQSTLGSNATHPDCDDLVCADFAVSKRPRLDNSDCERSLNSSAVSTGASLLEFEPTLHDWQACSLD